MRRHCPFTRHGSHEDTCDAIPNHGWQLTARRDALEAHAMLHDSCREARLPCWWNWLDATQFNT